MPLCSILKILNCYEQANLNQQTRYIVLNCLMISGLHVLHNFPYISLFDTMYFVYNNYIFLFFSFFLSPYQYKLFYNTTGTHKHYC